MSAQPFYLEYPNALRCFDVHIDPFMVIPQWFIA